jgi:DNA-binding response OmpR family regulator
MKSILIIDDDVKSSLKFKRGLEDEGFYLTIIKDPDFAKRDFKCQKYNVIFIGLQRFVG